MADGGMSRDEIVSNFQAMTNKDDIAECLAILESVDWDLTAAVNVAIEDATPPPPFVSVQLLTIQLSSEQRRPRRRHSSSSTKTTTTTMMKVGLS